MWYDLDAVSLFMLLHMMYHFPVIVKAFWCEGKIDEAVEAVRDMEQRGVVGTGSVYYELASCLCNSGRWQDALVEVSFFLCGF